MKTFIIGLSLLIISSNSYAQGWTNPHVADVISTVEVSSSLGLDIFRDFRAPDRKHAFLVSAERIGVKILLAEVTKHYVHENRPDNSDNKSFFSEHTELATAF